MKGFRDFSRLRTRAPGSLETNPLSNRQHSATAACKALISSLPLVRLGSIADRCRVLTMPKWTPRFFRGHPGNQILSVISVMEFCNLGGEPFRNVLSTLIWPQLH